jgi:hypothetical protein
MSISGKRNGGAYARSEYAANGSATAAGAGDNTVVNGAWVSRKGASGVYKSAKLVITFDAAINAAESLSFAVKLRDATSSGGAGAADVAATHINPNVAYPATIVASGAATKSSIEFDFNLETCREFIGCQITPDLSRSATDTVVWQASWVFFGPERQPVSKSLV